MTTTTPGNKLSSPAKRVQELNDNEKFTIDVMDSLLSSIAVLDSNGVIVAGVGQEFITGVFNHADRLLIIMDVDRMFINDEIESFGEM